VASLRRRVRIPGIEPHPGPRSAFLPRDARGIEGPFQLLYPLPLQRSRYLFEVPLRRCLFRPSPSLTPWRRSPKKTAGNFPPQGSHRFLPLRVVRCDGRSDLGLPESRRFSWPGFSCRSPSRLPEEVYDERRILCFFSMSLRKSLPF